MCIHLGQRPQSVSDTLSVRTGAARAVLLRARAAGATGRARVLPINRRTMSPTTIPRRASCGGSGATQLGEVLVLRPYPGPDDKARSKFCGRLVVPGRKLLLCARISCREQTIPEPRESLEQTRGCTAHSSTTQAQTCATALPSSRTMASLRAIRIAARRLPRSISMSRAIVLCLRSPYKSDGRSRCCQCLNRQLWVHLQNWSLVCLTEAPHTVSCWGSIVHGVKHNGCASLRVWPWSGAKKSISVRGPPPSERLANRVSLSF